jgi:hypothetical protein
MRSVMRFCLVGGFLAAGCTGNGVQPIAGHISLATFPAAVTRVRASRPGAAAIEAAVGRDGGFLLRLPRGRHYRIDFPLGAADASLVYPRKTGSTDFRFDVRGGGARFDMGTVRYMGPGDAMTVVFRHSQAQSTTPPAAPGPAVDCDDGHDKATGAVCADDDPEDEGKSCDDDDKGGTGDDGVMPPAVAVADQNIPPAVGSCTDDDDDGDKEGD